MAHIVSIGSSDHVWPCWITSCLSEVWQRNSRSRVQSRHSKWRQTLVSGPWCGFESAIVFAGFHDVLDNSVRIDLRVRCYCDCPFEFFSVQ